MAGIDPQTRSALAPTGRLRVGIAVGSAISATWTKRDAVTGQPVGPTVDLATIFAERAGLPLALVEYGSSGEIIQAASAGNWDVSFTPVDAERKTVVDFGPAFALGESTYMVPAGSTIASLGDVDRPGARIFGVENTATIRASRKSLKNTTAIGLTSLDEVLAKFRNGEADAIALGKELLLSILSDFPGSENPGRTLSGARHRGCRAARACGGAASLQWIPGRTESGGNGQENLRQARHDQYDGRSCRVSFLDHPSEFNEGSTLGRSARTGLTGDNSLKARRTR